MMEQIKVKVANKVREAEAIVSLELVSADGTRLPPFKPGAHIDVQVQPGLVRQYSLLNDASEHHRYVIGVLRDPNSRGGSVVVHETIRAGDTIMISPPKNHFELVQAERIVLFAGGIGVTPLLCMARHLSRMKADFQMHYCARSRTRAAFLDVIKASSLADSVSFHFDDDPTGPALDLGLIRSGPQPGMHLYVCGPAGFIGFITDTAAGAGWPAAQVHVEHFAAGQIDSSDDAEFQVRIAQTGQTFTVPVGQTILQVLEAHDIYVPTSCEEGVCGTCLTRVTQGIPDHRDLVLTEAEHAANTQMTPCCSRSKSPLLELDL